MKIGFDIDGVLANFPKGYQDTYVAVTGVDRFLPDDVHNPPDWNWDMMRGYSKDEQRMVWTRIKSSEFFWFDLEPLPGMDALESIYKSLNDHHDIYFPTSRVGVQAKKQTEGWLRYQLAAYEPTETPTVLLSGHKGHAASALDLDVYIDDNWDNAVSVRGHSPKTRMYLLDRRYNNSNVGISDKYTASMGIIRVPSVQAMLDAELDNIIRS